MRLDRIITLISITFGKDEAGYPTEPKETKRETMAREISVKRSEFYAANQNGLRADVTFEIWQAEYQGEKYFEHNGKRYEVIRTYNTSHLMMEITGSDISVKS